MMHTQPITSARKIFVHALSLELVDLTLYTELAASVELHHVREVFFTGQLLHGVHKILGDILAACNRMESLSFDVFKAMSWHISKCRE